METVKAFNDELYSLNEHRPPISKTKMSKITKIALKAKKFYKHVVQSVEIYIQRCKPEYKVPGLYVIDSIVRQSRHQFGQDRDVFAPRFSRNLEATFENLYRCPSADRSKIVKVLILWQKNNVFASDIMRPLLDTAIGPSTPTAPPVPVCDASAAAAPVTCSSLEPVSTAAHAMEALSSAVFSMVTPVPAGNPADAEQSFLDRTSLMNGTDTIAVITHILESPQGQRLVQSLQLQQQRNPQRSLLQALDAGLVVQLQALSSELLATALPSMLSTIPEKHPEGPGKQDARKDFSQLQSVLEPFSRHLSHHLPEKRALAPRHSHRQPETLFPVVTPSESSNCQEPVGADKRTIHQRQYHTEKKMASSVRSRSRSGSPRKQRWRSPSGSCTHELHKRSSSSSGDWNGRSSQCHSNDREQERLQRGLPPVRWRTLSVCSSTLRVEQFAGTVTKQDLGSLFEEFGQIESVEMIPPRSCAYVCMVHRRDAQRALQKMSWGSYKIGSATVEVSWARNRGVKQEYQHLWDGDLGVTYIPWEMVNLDDLSGLAEGGVIDRETLDSEWEAVLGMGSPGVSRGPAPLETIGDCDAQPVSSAGPVAMAPLQGFSAFPVISGAPPTVLIPPTGCDATPAQRAKSLALTAPENPQVTVSMVPVDPSDSGEDASHPPPDPGPPAAVGLDTSVHGVPRGKQDTVGGGLGLLGSCPSASLHQPSMVDSKMPGPSHSRGLLGDAPFPLGPLRLRVPLNTSLGGFRKPLYCHGSWPTNPEMVYFGRDGAQRGMNWGYHLPSLRAPLVRPMNPRSGRPFLLDWRRGSPWMGPRGFLKERPTPYCSTPNLTEDQTRGGRRPAGRWPVGRGEGWRFGPNVQPAADSYLLKNEQEEGADNQEG